MTRDQFFVDVTKALQLLAKIGIPELKAETEGRVASMRGGDLGVTADDLRRYAEAIDWTQQRGALALGELARVLLRLVAGLASELASLRRASE